MPLSILHLAARSRPAVLGAFLPARAAPLAPSPLGSTVALGIAIGSPRRFERGGGLQCVTDQNVDLRRSASTTSSGSTGSTSCSSCSRRDLRWPRSRCCARPARAGEPRRSSSSSTSRSAESAVLGALLRPGPAALRGLLRPDADPVLLPDRAVGRAGDRVRATTKLVIYTLVGSLLMLAAAIATGVLAAPQTARRCPSPSATCAAHPLPTGTQDWIFLCFAAAFLVKMPAFPVHGWMPDAYRTMPLPALAAFSGVLSKVAAYGFLRIVLPLFPRRDRALPDADPAHRAGLDPLRLGDGLHDDRGPARRSATPRSRSSASSRSGSSRCSAPGRRARCCSASTTALVVAPLFFIVGLLAARAGGSEDLRDMGGIAFRAPVLATAVPDRRAGHAGHARAPPTSRANSSSCSAPSRPSRRSRSWPSPASRWPPSTCCAPSSARCTTASGRTSTHAR